MNLVIILVYIVLALAGLGLLAMLVFGARSMAYGKVKPMAMVIIALPVVILVVLGFVLGDWSLAAIYTVMVMMVLGVLSLLVTGLQGLFT